MNVINPHPMVCIIEKNIVSGEKLNFLLLSDLHLDHPKCNRELLKQHLDECVAKKGYILLNGDILCVMQGVNDKRHNKSSVRPEHMTDNHFDSIVEETAEFLLPYAKRILFMGSGNHEAAIVKRAETDLLKRLSDLIYYKTKHRIVVGEYHGWIYIKGIYGSDKLTRRQKSTCSYLIYHNHGTGGDAAVTGGSIEDHRKMTHVEGADAIWMGHNHNKYAKQQSVHFFDKNPQSMKPKLRIVENIRTGTYKQEYTGHGFHIMTGKGPKPLGGVWLELKMCHNKTTNAIFFSPSLTPTWHNEIEID